METYGPITICSARQTKTNAAYLIGSSQHQVGFFQLINNFNNPCFQIITLRPISQREFISGNPFWDIGPVAFVSMNEEKTEKHLDEILQSYYNKLNLSCTKLGKQLIQGGWMPVKPEVELDFQDWEKVNFCGAATTRLKLMLWALDCISPSFGRSYPTQWSTCFHRCDRGIFGYWRLTIDCTPSCMHDDNWRRRCIYFFKFFIRKNLVLYFSHLKIDCWKLDIDGY